MKKSGKKILFLILTILIIAVLSLAILLGINALGGVDALTRKITSISEKHFLAGLLLFLFFQVLQIVLSVIPGEPLEVMSGMLYGVLGGFFWCTVGIVIGTSIIFWFVRKYGLKFAEKFINVNELFDYEFIKNSRKLETVIFILFLIPGTPKDVLIYAAAMTKINMGRFLTITSFARIPSIITSTYAGAALGQGDYIKTIIAFVVIALIGLMGIYIHPKIMSKLKKSSNR